MRLGKIRERKNGTPKSRKCFELLFSIPFYERNISIFGFSRNSTKAETFVENFNFSNGANSFNEELSAQNYQFGGLSGKFLMENLFFDEKVRSVNKILSEKRLEGFEPITYWILFSV